MTGARPRERRPLRIDGRRVDGSAVAEVQAHDRSRLHGRECALAHRCRARVLVVGRIDVVPHHRLIVRGAGDIDDDRGRRVGAVGRPGWTKEPPAATREPRDGVATSNDLGCHGRLVERRERRMGVRVVRDLVALVEEPRPQISIGVEPVADHEGGDGDMVHSQEIQETRRQLRVTTHVERECNLLAVTGPCAHEAGHSDRARRSSRACRRRRRCRSSSARRTGRNHAGRGGHGGTDEGPTMKHGPTLRTLRFAVGSAPPSPR